ncbi:hypothetical protein D3C87_429240 [compost metagenome]
MKVYTTNYKNTFIAVADDSTVAKGEVPAKKASDKTIAGLQFELISKNPYKYTSDDVLLLIYAQRNELTEEELEDVRKEFFSKGQACLRASALGKRYGWGIHHNAEGKIAIYGCETRVYQDFLNQAGIKVVKAMRSKK